MLLHSIRIMITPRKTHLYLYLEVPHAWIHIYICIQKTMPENDSVLKMAEVGAKMGIEETITFMGHQM